MRDDSTWERIALGSLVPNDRPICYGVLKPGEYHPDGVPLIRIVDLSPNNTLLEENLLRISHTLDKEFSRSRLMGREVLLSIQGTIGRVAVTSESIAGANISRTIARIALTKLAEPSYIRHWLLSAIGQRELLDAVVGTTRDSLNIGKLRKIKIALPGRGEQQQIAEILDTLDDQIQHI
jgi:type I restriction enzyme S subunit